MNTNTDCCCPPPLLYSSASASGYALTTTGNIVTSTATSTASGATYEEAYLSAEYQAKQVAEITAQNDANIISQTIEIIETLNLSPINHFYVTNLNDDGDGSFRQCLINSNKSFNSQIIFNVSGTIQINSDLPYISSRVNILGVTAPTYNIDNLPVVTIDFNDYNGIVLNNNSNNTIINGLTLLNSANNGITIVSSNNTIINCFITENKKNGIYLSPNSRNNIIGEYKYSSTSQKIASNLICNNNSNGILFDNSSYNITNNNYIGTNYSGTESNPNGLNGILVTNNSINNTFGTPVYTDSAGNQNNPTGTFNTTTPIFVIPPYGNLISGNKLSGIFINASRNNSLYGNFIGTTSDGNSILGNGENGVTIFFSDNTNIIGCTFENNPFVYYNVISGNKINGISISFSNNSVVQGNFIGIGANNKCLVPNNKDGIFVGVDSSNTSLGGVIPLGNVVSGNDKNGIHLSYNSQGAIIFNAFCGVYSFGGAAPNKQNGLLIDTTSSRHTIGSNNTFNGSRTCLFSGNNENGIVITDSANNITIGSIICGASGTSNVAIPNKKNGILIEKEANNNIIGSNVLSVAIKTCISGNGENGILITDNSNNNTITNCNIGLSINEQESLPNGLNGVCIDKFSTNNNIGIRTTEILIYNVICNNTKYGVFLGDAVELNTVSYNYIGVNTLREPEPNELGNVNSGYPISNSVRNNITK